MSLFQELKRRNVFRMGIAYAVVAWLLLQLIDIVTPIINAPDWVSKSLLLLIVIGFPITLLIAWAFELLALIVLIEWFAVLMMVKNAQLLPHGH